MSEGDCTPLRLELVGGLQWAVTAFYLVAIGHGLSDSGDADVRAWTRIYVTVMTLAFVTGCRRTNTEAGHAKRGRVTALLLAEYALLRTAVAALDAVRRDRTRNATNRRHFIGAAIETAALVLAYAAVYRRSGAMSEANKTQ